MHTEQEAKELWCPMARVANCLGTGCAMWRWKEDLWQVRLKSVPYEAEDRFERQTEPTPRPANVPENYVWHGGDCDGAAFWSEPDDERAARRTGYCGLAPIVTIGPHPNP